MDRPDTKARWHDGFGRIATRSAQTLLVLAMVVVVTFVGVQLRLVVVPVLIAVLIAAAATPLVDLLDRRMPRLAAVWTTLVMGLAALGAVAWLVGDSVAEQFDELREGVTDGITQLQEYIASGPFGLPATDVGDLTEQLQGVLQGSAVQSGAVTGATAVAQVATGVVLALVVLFYLLKDGRQMWAFFRDQLPERTHARFDLVGTRSSSVLGGYVRGTAVVALVDSVLIGVGLLILGTPLALPLALLVFVGAFVPIIGAVAAGSVAVLIALALQGPVEALIVLGIVIAVNQIEGNFLAPIVLGRSLSLHPLVILLALAAGSIVAGIVGAILAVPFAAVAWAAVQASREADAEERAMDAAVTRSRAPDDPALADAREVEGRRVEQDAKQGRRSLADRVRARLDRP
ncbi:AI-2E family transporter [Aquipuribacter sp. MA13-6]|uniref:AI-2E family transporter n=1 Tax=unclassified Aquipuribacter TaxID=2635084 RepID=UPI003EEF76B6